jgi:hypothetical protein
MTAWRRFDLGTVPSTGIVYLSISVNGFIVNEVGNILLDDTVSVS